MIVWKTYIPFDVCHHVEYLLVVSRSACHQPRGQGQMFDTMHDMCAGSVVVTGGLAKFEKYESPNTGPIRVL